MLCFCLKPQKFPKGVKELFPTEAHGTTLGECGTRLGVTPIGRHSLRTPHLHQGLPWECPTGRLSCLLPSELLALGRQQCGC